MNERLMKITNLNYSYADGKQVLKNVNMEIDEGERIAVVGSNGAGKSTFFLNLNGVLTPDSGEICYRGKVIANRKKDLNLLRKAVGIVFQDAENQIIASTVRSEISFGPMNLKLPKEEVIRRVDEAIAYMNLEKFKDRPPHYLSGGEKKRVTIADILAMGSEIIVFDEPTASLDPLNVEMLEEVLKRMSDQGKTLVISTHDMDFVYRWADRVIVFAGGEIIAEGNPQEIFEDTKVLKKANLRVPVMAQVCRVLQEKGVLSEENWARNVDEFKQLF